MEINLDFLVLVILICFAGFVDSIAGGGGLITIPAYLNYGININELLGTNKLSSTTGTLIATLKYFEDLKFEKKYILTILFFSFIFSTSGALFVSKIPSYYLKIIIISIIPVISIYLIKKKELGMIDLSNKISNKQRYIRTILISSIISFYDGIFGPGTGTFLAVLYSKFIGYDILKSTALAKFTNLISNISALLAFLILGMVNIKIGIIGGIFSIIGNYLGSNIALKKGAKIIKPMLVLISNLILIKIIHDFVK